MRVLTILGALFSASAAFGQVPAPPVPEAQGAVLGSLEQAYEDRDLSAYAALLADNLVVTVDNEVVADTKAAWLDRFGKKLTTDGVFMKLENAYQASGRLLTVEYFNSVESFASQNRHCCWRYDAVQYGIEDGKISTISVLSGGDTIR